jgi:hypothetical protein
MAAKVCAYAQGFALMRAADREHQWQLPMAQVAKVWRAGCIIRAHLLEDIRRAFQTQADLPNLLVDPHFARFMDDSQQDLREVVAAADTADSGCTGISGATTRHRNVSDEDVGKHLIVGISATNSSGSTVRFTGSIYVVSTTCDAFAQEICPNSVQYDYGWSFDDQTAQANHIVSVVNQEAELSVFITMAEPYENPYSVQHYHQNLFCSGDSAPESEEDNFSLVIEAIARNGVVTSRIEINGQSVAVQETDIVSGGARRVTLTFAIPQGTPSLILTCQSGVGGWNDDPQQGPARGLVFGI